MELEAVVLVKITFHFAVCKTNFDDPLSFTLKVCIFYFAVRNMLKSCFAAFAVKCSTSSL